MAKGKNKGTREKQKEANAAKTKKKTAYQQENEAAKGQSKKMRRNMGL